MEGLVNLVQPLPPLTSLAFPVISFFLCNMRESLAALQLTWELGRQHYTHTHTHSLFVVLPRPQSSPLKIMTHIFTWLFIYLMDISGTPGALEWLLWWRGAGAGASEGGGCGVGVAVKVSLGPPIFQSLEVSGCWFPKPTPNMDQHSLSTRGAPSCPPQEPPELPGFPWSWLPVKLASRSWKDIGMPPPAFLFFPSLPFFSLLPSFPPPHSFLSHWSTIDLQRCAHFSYTAKWLRCTYIRSFS